MISLIKLFIKKFVKWAFLGILLLGLLVFLILFALLIGKTITTFQIVIGLGLILVGLLLFALYDSIEHILLSRKLPVFYNNLLEGCKIPYRFDFLTLAVYSKENSFELWIKKLEPFTNGSCEIQIFVNPLIVSDSKNGKEFLQTLSNIGDFEISVEGNFIVFSKFFNSEDFSVKTIEQYFVDFKTTLSAL